MNISKKIALSMLLYTSTGVFACRNTISNNTQTTYKIAEITQANKDLKKQHYLPNEYLSDELKAHTLKPGEEVSFGGHYLPTFAVFKKYPDDRWHLMLIVKQNECGPRGPENKYLLLTDILKCKLPDDYNPVYTFIRRKQPEELWDESKNKTQLTAVANPYQELQNIMDDTTQKLQELMSNLISTCPVPKAAPKPEAATPALAAQPTAEQKTPAQAEKAVMEGEDGKTCAACAA